MDKKNARPLNSLIRNNYPSTGESDPMKQKSLLKLALIGLTAGLFLSAQSVSASKDVTTVKKEVVAPKKEVVAEKKDVVVTPKKDVADKEAVVKKEVATEKKEVVAEPKDATTPKKEIVTDKEVMTSKKEIVADKEVATPKKEAIVEKKEVAMTKCSKESATASSECKAKVSEPCKSCKCEKGSCGCGKDDGKPKHKSAAKTAVEG